MNTYDLYLKVFNGLIPVDLALKIHIPYLYDLTDYEVKYLFKKFMRIYTTIIEYHKIKRDINLKKR